MKILMRFGLSTLFHTHTHTYSYSHQHILTHTLARVHTHEHTTLVDGVPRVGRRAQLGLLVLSETSAQGPGLSAVSLGTWSLCRLSPVLLWEALGGAVLFIYLFI